MTDHPTSLGAERCTICLDPLETIVDDAVAGTIKARRPFPYRTSHQLEELEVNRPGEPNLFLVAKHLGREAMTEAARLAKPSTLEAAGRELGVYQDILAGVGLGTPVLVGGWASPHGGVLVLERVEGRPLTEIGDFAAWEASARWLARMHAMYVDAPRLISRRRGPAPLVHYDRELLGAAGRRGLARAEEQRMGSANERAALATGHERALKALVPTTVTLVHGDFYPSNILVAGSRIAVVDWELAGLGAGTLDLAALVAGRWGWERRRDLVAAYHEQATELGPTQPLADLVGRVALASLHVALCWIGSAPGWNAPPEHQRDWFTDAVAALAYFDGPDR